MNKDEKLGLTKEKLISAAIELMEQAEDPLEVTSREIAGKAEVKPSMINYCFGSREELLYTSFHRLYMSFLSDKNVEELIKADLPPKELLKKLHFIVAKCLVEHFKFTKATTPLVLFKRNLGEESFSFAYVKKHYNGRKNDTECRLIAYELSTMMQLIVFRKDDIKKDFGVDLENDGELQKFIDFRVDLLLGE
ncbi:MAG: hypothetical protein J6U54_06980 [Clostridiales bacterium]|nr:hypothetical protein [Clostridiales bacterium]